MINEQLKKEVSQIIYDYIRDYPTLGGTDELAEIILERVGQVLPQANVSGQFCRFGCELRDGIWYAKNGHRCASGGGQNCH